MKEQTMIQSVRAGKTIRQACRYAAMMRRKGFSKRVIRKAVERIYGIPNYDSKW